MVAGLYIHITPYNELPNRGVAWLTWHRTSGEIGKDELQTGFWQRSAVVSMCMLWSARAEKLQTWTFECVKPSATDSHKVVFPRERNVLFTAMVYASRPVSSVVHTDVLRTAYFYSFITNFYLDPRFLSKVRSTLYSVCDNLFLALILRGKNILV